MFPRTRTSVGVAAFPGRLELLLPARGGGALIGLWSLALKCHMGLGYFSFHLIVLWELISLRGGSDGQVRGEPAAGSHGRLGPLLHLLCLLLLLPPLHFLPAAFCLNPAWKEVWTTGVAAGSIENGRNGAGCTAIGMGDGECSAQESRAVLVTQQG